MIRRRHRAVSSAALTSCGRAPHHLGQERSRSRCSLANGAGSMSSLTVGGLFSGIGGLEKGLSDAGLSTSYLCEIDPFAVRVLKCRFPGIRVHGDVAKIAGPGPVDVLCGGSPCQDLSQAGQLAGISGSRSSLVDHVFRLSAVSPSRPRWVVLENVPFMLKLERGKAVEHVVLRLESLGFTWAYRVVDTRAFGLPQRRRRVYFVASRSEDPRAVLFADEEGPREFSAYDRHACGFYWTEGNTGVGWAVNAVPPLKGGSGIGIPSPPAIRMPRTRDFVLPDIRDAERLQGFPDGWSSPALNGAGKSTKGVRWRLIGNAVSVPVAKWLGKRLQRPGTYKELSSSPMPQGGKWPNAAWGRRGERYIVDIGAWPHLEKYSPLSAFLQYEPRLLPEGAASGFHRRAKASGLKFVPGFLEDLGAHVQAMQERDRTH